MLRQTCGAGESEVKTVHCVSIIPENKFITWIKPVVDPEFVPKKPNPGRRKFPDPGLRPAVRRPEPEERAPPKATGKGNCGNNKGFTIWHPKGNCRRTEEPYFCPNGNKNHQNTCTGEWHCGPKGITNKLDKKKCHDNKFMNLNDVFTHLGISSLDEMLRDGSNHGGKLHRFRQVDSADVEDSGNEEGGKAGGSDEEGRDGGGGADKEGTEGKEGSDEGEIQEIQERRREGEGSESTSTSETLSEAKRDRDEEMLLEESERSRKRLGRIGHHHPLHHPRRNGMRQAPAAAEGGSS